MKQCTIKKYLCAQEKKACAKKDVACSKVEVAEEVAESKCAGLNLNVTDTEIKANDTACVVNCKKARAIMVQEQDKCKQGSLGCQEAIPNFETKNATAFLKKILKIWDPLLRGLSKDEPDVGMYEDKSKETKKLLDAFDKRFGTIPGIKNDEMEQFQKKLMKNWEIYQTTMVKKHTPGPQGEWLDPYQARAYDNLMKTIQSFVQYMTASVANGHFF